jgi:hypothetical protein
MTAFESGDLLGDDDPDADIDSDADAEYAVSG